MTLVECVLAGGDVDLSHDVERRDRGNEGGVLAADHATDRVHQRAVDAGDLEGAENRSVIFGRVRRMRRVGRRGASSAAKEPAPEGFGVQAATRYSLMSPRQVVVRRIGWSSLITDASPWSVGARWPRLRWGR